VSLYPVTRFAKLRILVVGRDEAREGGRADLAYPLITREHHHPTRSREQTPANPDRRGARIVHRFGRADQVDRVDDGTARDRFVICRNPERAQPRPRGARADPRPPERADRGLGQAHRDQAPRALRRARDQARVQALAAPDRDRQAAHRPRRRHQWSQARRQVFCSEPATRASGYKALYEAERGWRDLKSTIDMRPVYHRR
jgi:hypothetical protein